MLFGIWYFDGLAIVNYTVSNSSLPVIIRLLVFQYISEVKNSISSGPDNMFVFVFLFLIYLKHNFGGYRIFIHVIKSGFVVRLTR